MTETDGPAPPRATDQAPAPARRLAAPLGVLAGVLAAFGLVGAVDPNEPGHYPACPLLRLTGVYCPGCGGLRSAYAVAHGDLLTALGANALAVVGYGAFAVFWVLWCVRALRGRSPAAVPPLVLRRLRGVWAVIGVALAFGVVRNLPFGGALVP